MNKRAFTLVEIAIAAIVLSILMGGCMFLYQRSNAAFSITLWKQERTAQAERFWTHFRKNIEEASDLLEIPDDQMGLPHPHVQKTKEMPILVHTSAGSLKENDNANLLAWNVSILDIDFDNGKHSSKSEIFQLVKEGRKVSLKGSKSKPVAELDDVVAIAFDIKTIVKADDTSYETIVSNTVATGTAKIVGTLLEISLTMAPPKTSISEQNKIPQNHKFRLNVAADMSADPKY